MVTMHALRLPALLLALGVGVALGSPRILDVLDVFKGHGEAHGKVPDIEAKYRLPKGFLFGSGTSAYQAEGAWDHDGKGVSVFDHYYHSRNYSVDRTGDVSADSYHRYKEDFDVAASLGLNVFRLSISWARIFPNGRNDSVNWKGVQHYHDVLDYMKSKRIEPTVTLFHFDYPQALEDEFGGWLSDKMPEVFASYADFVFNEYGSKVKLWLTINEAAMYCNLAGGRMAMVPPMTITNANKPTCLHNLILGHALAHKVYHDKYKAKYNGLVGFGVGPEYSRPATDSAEDKAAADKANLGGGIGLSLHPLVYGKYPDEAGDRPAFTEEQKKLLSVRRVDWAGVNIYGGRNASAAGGGGDDGPPGPPGPPDGDGSGGGPPDDGGSGGGGPPADGGGPPGDGGSGGHDGGHGGHGIGSAWVLREMPKWIKERYDNVPVFITENGLSVSTTDDWDTRAVYFSAFLRELVAGINEDKNNVIGYTSWSFIDSFEFRGYGVGWGMVSVDYSGGTLKRTPKQSATFFKTLTRNWAVPLVEAGSKPFPDPDDPVAGSASLQGSIALAVVAACASRMMAL